LFVCLFMKQAFQLLDDLIITSMLKTNLNIKFCGDKHALDTNLEPLLFRSNCSLVFYSDRVCVHIVLFDFVVFSPMNKIILEKSWAISCIA
jgi:hypothetical protein